MFHNERRGRCGPAKRRGLEENIIKIIIERILKILKNIKKYYMYIILKKYYKDIPDIFKNREKFISSLEIYEKFIINKIREMNIFS